MACEFDPDACRSRHIYPRLSDASPDGSDYEARCPVCGHGGFRISKAAVRKYRHIWTCACKRCGRGRGCGAGILRVYLLRLDIPAACLGIYDGATSKDIDAETAQRMYRTINDILAVPHLKSSDIRLILAESQGREIPADYAEFVRFAKGVGVSQQQAYEAARRWLGRPSDCRPLTGGGVVTDTSRSTGASEVVKQASSEPRDLTDLVNQHHQKGKDAPPVTLTETVNRANPDIQPAA